MITLNEAWKNAATEAITIFAAKNADYGDSYKSAGLPGLLVRLLDKFNRAHSLLALGRAQVAAEALHDTLIDAANYSIMALAMHEHLQGRLSTPLYSGALDLVFAEYNAHADLQNLRLSEAAFGLALYLRDLLQAQVELHHGTTLYVKTHRLREDLIESAVLCLLLAGTSCPGSPPC